MNKKSPAKTRTGAAMIEMAVCLPVFVLLVFGTIEINEAIFRKQTLTSAAHEGALLGMKHAASELDIEARVWSVLNARGMGGCMVEVDCGGMPMEDLTPGSEFIVRVQTPSGSTRFGLGDLTVEVTGLRP